jgi:hypothetical protein
MTHTVKSLTARLEKNTHQQGELLGWNVPREQAEKSRHTKPRDLMHFFQIDLLKVKTNLLIILFHVEIWVLVKFLQFF